MAISLINDFIRKTDLIRSVSNDATPKWFAGIRFIDVLFSIVIPGIIITICMFILKDRYVRKMKKSSIGRYIV